MSNLETLRGLLWTRATAADVARSVALMQSNTVKQWVVEDRLRKLAKLRERLDAGQPVTAKEILEA